MTPPLFNEADDPLKNRRAQASQAERTDVTFVPKQLSDERLHALKEFLKTASGNEILAIRRLYGDNPQVLQSIGLEIMPSQENDKNGSNPEGHELL